jgi:peptidyl-prolyl cis-trans isomerase-like 6|eukprot:Stramenopile-MAST_4_protein_2747
MSTSGATNVLLSIVGNLDDADFHKCRILGEAIEEEFSPVTLDVQAMTHTDYEDFKTAKSKELGGAAYEHNTSPFIYYNGCNYIGGVQEFQTWARRVYEIQVERPSSEYEEIAYNTKNQFMADSKSSFCYLDVQLEGQTSERVTIELYDYVCPKTCENFRRLCTGENGRSYTGSPFHRVMKNGYVQGGDIDGGRGDGGNSAAGGSLPDEGFSILHDKSGIVSMANTGPHSNKSQFFVTLKALKFLDKRCVAFGRVVFGMSVFNAINNLPAENQRPLKLPQIVGGGCVEPKVDTK